MSQSYCELIDELKQSARPSIYIYGAGKLGKIVWNICNAEHIKIKAFCVTSKMGNENKISGVPVIEMGMVNTEDDESIFIIAVVERGNKIIENHIREYGFSHILYVDEDLLELDPLVERRKKNPIIEVTTKIGCSINCKYCPQKKLLNSYFNGNPNRKSVMELDDFKTILHNTPDDCIIDFSGFAEPFLNPDAIEMMEYADREGREMALFTTLQGLTMDGLERLLKINFSMVVLHVADNDGFAKISVTDEYIKMLTMLVSGKDKYGQPFVDSANCQSIPHKRVLDAIGGKMKIYCEMQDRAGNLTEDIGGTLSSKCSRGKLVCDRAYNTDHFVVLPDGTTVLCCNDYGLTAVLGNLKTNRFEEIVQGDRFTDYKKQMTDGKGSNICNKCVFARSVDEKSETDK